MADPKLSVAAADIDQVAEFLFHPTYGRTAALYLMTLSLHGHWPQVQTQLEQTPGLMRKFEAFCQDPNTFSALQANVQNCATAFRNHNVDTSLANLQPS